MTGANNSSELMPEQEDTANLLERYLSCNREPLRRLLSPRFSGSIACKGSAKDAQQFVEGDTCKWKALASKAKLDLQ